MSRNLELQQISTISTEELASKNGDLDFQLIDVRPTEAYNGWKLDNELRGGNEYIFNPKNYQKPIDFEEEYNNFKKIVSGIGKILFKLYLDMGGKLFNSPPF